jgi:phosphomethylpyrimidine synthase
MKSCDEKKPDLARGEFKMSHPNSTKVYLQGEKYPELRVPVRKIALQNGDDHFVYDSSGPYSDPDVAIDLNNGLPALRKAWINQRREAFGTENVSQLHYARRGVITEEMEYVAIRENLVREKTRKAIDKLPEREARLKGAGLYSQIPGEITAEFVRDQIATGQAIIPANINHPKLSQ